MGGGSALSSDQSVTFFQMTASVLLPVFPITCSPWFWLWIKPGSKCTLLIVRTVSVTSLLYASPVKSSHCCLLPNLPFLHTVTIDESILFPQLNVSAGVQLTSSSYVMAVLSETLLFSEVNHCKIKVMLSVIHKAESFRIPALW